MAEFLDQPPPERPSDAWVDGFNAMGKMIPTFRRQAGYRDCKAMGLTSSEAAYSCVAQVAGALERDQTYEAMGAATRFVDLTGAYRLMAVLLCEPEPPKGDEP